MSHFYYIHKDVAGDPEFLKPGITVHPSNVVRGIQRKQSKKFSIDHLYFGRPDHVQFLEKRIKDHYKHLSGKALLEWGNQTELFKINEAELLKSVAQAIENYELDIIKIELSEPYHGTNQSNCPLSLPGENDRWYFDDKVDEMFGYKSYKGPKYKANINALKAFKNLFEE